MQIHLREKVARCLIAFLDWFLSIPGPIVLLMQSSGNFKISNDAFREAFLISDVFVRNSILFPRFRKKTHTFTFLVPSFHHVHTRLVPEMFQAVPSVRVSKRLRYECRMANLFPKELLFFFS